MRLLSLLALAPCLAIIAAPANPELTGFPFTDETLNYNINWPSGLSLGEGHLRARHSTGGWAFALTLDASVPGFAVKDSYSSRSNSDFCSIEFSKQFAHGARQGSENEAIDRSHETATRTTVKDGKEAGKSEFPIPDCVKDALTLLFYARRELGQGRVPPPQSVLFGGLYQARLDYAGAEMIQIAERPVQTDKIVCSLKGPASSVEFEIYFARDPARTPLLFKVPLPLGRFSMELVR